MIDAIRTPQELEHLIIIASDPTASSTETDVKAATSVLDTIRNELDVNIAAFQCIQLLSFTQNVHAKFFAWSTLQICLSARNSLMKSPRGIVEQTSRIKIREIVLKGNAGGETSIPRETFIRTQMGVVIALLIQCEFPQYWPNAFSDIMQILVASTSADRPEEQFLKMDLFLRILDGVCDEIIETNENVAIREKNTIIKDTMRGFLSLDGGKQDVDTKNTVIYPIIEALTNIAHHYTQISKQTSMERSNYNLASNALSVLKRFIPWIDLTYIMNESVISLLYLSLTGKCVDDAEYDISTALAIESIDCLHELICRGMIIQKKIQLLTEINLFSNLINCDVPPTPTRSGVCMNENTNIYLAIKVSQLVNSAGIELVECWEKQKKDRDLADHETVKKTAILLQQFMPLFFHCFTYDDIDVTSAVLQVASSIVIALGKEVQYPDRKSALFAFSPYLPRFFTEIYKQMQYPQDFQFDQNSDEDAEEQVFRYDLRKLYIKVIRASPRDLSLQFLCQIFTNISMPLSSTPPMPLEAALRLLFHYSEGIRPNAASVMKIEPFYDLIFGLHSSNVSLHPLGEISILYFDIAVRYIDIFKSKPELLPGVLDAITSTRGLQHPTSVRIRSRSCYSLLRLVKGMSTDGRMKGYVDAAVAGIQNLLSNPDLHLEHDDTLYLFETIGLLLGTPGNLSADIQTQYLRAVISPHIHSIESTLKAPNILRDPEHYGHILSQSIAAISYLSKGFGRGPQENVQILLAETLNVSLRVLQTLPNEEKIRNKTMILIQRMILCLSHDKLLTILPAFLHALIDKCTGEDILNVSQLLNQICLKYKHSGAAVLDAAVYPFIQKCQSIIFSLLESCQVPTSLGSILFAATSTQILPPHIQVEQHSIKKMVYSFLQHIVCNGATIIFLSPSNLPNLENILQMVLEGITKSDDASAKKVCIVFFKELILQWGGYDFISTSAHENRSISDPEQLKIVQNGLIQFVFQTLLPGTINCILDPSFKERDAMQARNLNEISLLLNTVRATQGDVNFENQFVHPTLSVYNLPSNLMANFRNARETKDMSSCLKELMSILKTS